MNEMLTGLRGRVDLRFEAPFRLARLRISPATLEVAGPEGVSTLEPRVMQVLVALHRNRGEAVSREELSDLCWEGRIVGEDALNRSVSRLRKALAAEPAVAVDTIPKVGYRLRIGQEPAAVAAPAPAAGAPPQQEASRARPWKTWGAGLAGLAVLLLIAGWAVLASRGPTAWAAGTLRPITREPGVETQPALSPRGRWLAYSGGPGFGAPRDIFLRGLSLGESAPLQLTATPADEHSPAWSPDGTRLAFSRAEPGRPCSIVVVEPPRGAERVVGGCRLDGHSELSWSGPEEIIFLDRTIALGPRRLFALNVGTGATRVLTDPPADSIGDYGPAVSPDGRRVAFRRGAAMGTHEVRLLDLRSGRERPVTLQGAKADGLGWSADSRSLFFTSNQNGDFGLWSTDPGRGPPRLVTVGLVWLGSLSADRENTLAVETSRVKSELVAATGAGVLQPVAAPPGQAWDGDISADGSVVYGSDVSGSYELWVGRPGQAPVRLTRFTGSYLFSPKWSPDGREVAFIGVQDGRTDVYVVRADGGGQRRVSFDGGRKGTVAWLAKGELVYSIKLGGRWRLYQSDTRNGAAKVLPGLDQAVLRRAPDGAFYARTPLDNRIRKLDLATGRLEVAGAGVEVADFESWAPAADGIWWLERSFDGHGTLWFTAWDGTRRQVARLAWPHRQSLSIRPSDGAPVFARLTQHEVDLVRLDLTR